MPYAAKILADSRGPSGARITTFEITHPRFVHAEFMTHRLFSRNAASSRAIPIEKMIDRVMTDPAMPKWWGRNRPGMQATEEFTDAQDLEFLKIQWLHARDAAVNATRTLSAYGLHKQLANRLLEPWMFITVIVTATEYENWFHLRCHPDAQPEIRWVAEEMKKLYHSHTPDVVPEGEWHLPLIQPADVIEVLDFVEHALDGTEKHKDVKLKLVNERLAKISVGRCARVSYLTHDGKRDHAADIELHDRLAKSGHWSPFEHVAKAALSAQYRSGNFEGWIQYRKTFKTEHAGKETRL